MGKEHADGLTGETGVNEQISKEITVSWDLGFIGEVGMLGGHTKHSILWQGAQPFELRSEGYIEAKAVKEK